MACATSPIVLKSSSFTNVPLTDTTRWAQFLKDYAPNVFKQNMYHQEFYTFFEIWANIPTTRVIFLLWKSLLGPVRDYLFTVTVTIILKASFLAVQKKLKLQKGEKRCETKDAWLKTFSNGSLRFVTFCSNTLEQALVVFNCRNCQITEIKTFLKRSKAPLRTLKERLTLKTQGGVRGMQFDWSGTV